MNFYIYGVFLSIFLPYQFNEKNYDDLNVEVFYVGLQGLGGERLFCLNFKSIKIIILNSYAMLVILQGIIFLLGLTKVISIQDNCILEPSY
jgi:hypothetical protein